MNVTRCDWAGTDPLYVAYHDTEWGVPVHDDRTHFEFLILEGAQAGLSWITILRKRVAYREAFSNFDPALVARFGKRKQASLLNNPGIVRNRLKIESSIRNAASFIAIQEEYGSFDNFIWKFTDGRPLVHKYRKMSEIPASTPLSDTISKELKRRGFNFVGTTIIYSYLQAVGLINDHIHGCFRYRELSG